MPIISYEQCRREMEYLERLGHPPEPEVTEAMLEAARDLVTLYDPHGGPLTRRHAFEEFTAIYLAMRPLEPKPPEG